MKKIFFTILFPCLFFFILTSQALADDLLISNPEQKIDLVPGGAEHFTLFVQNNTNNDLILETKIKSFKLIDNKENIQLFNDKKNVLVNSWLKQQANSSFKLLSGERRQVTFLISVPFNVENRGYYAAIYFIGHSQDKTGKIFESNKSRILLGVEAKDNNLLLRSGKIEELISPKFVFYGPVKFVVRFKNNGKIHYETNGQIEIYNLFNQKVAVIPIKKKNVLPNSSLYFYSNWKCKFLFGRYFVVAKMIDGDGNSSVKSENFFAFPWKEFLEFTVVLILIIIARKLRIKKLKFE
ncbi:MAG: hypothetical protein GWO87_01690 [Xanthomonadaceae bacterium]|nr:hypothetical protein [Rhodospirillaceae bacterium]NIA17883.1 hypothetical protein [Xanthomonadaceae bacterium]